LEPSVDASDQEKVTQCLNRGHFRVCFWRGSAPVTNA
jgi:hypothetical protein